MFALIFALAAVALARPNDNSFRLSAPILGSPVQPNVVDYYLSAPGSSYYSTNQLVRGRSGRQQQILTTAPVATAVQQLAVPVTYNANAVTYNSNAARTVIRAGNSGEVIVGPNGIRSRPAPLVR